MSSFSTSRCIIHPAKKDDLQDFIDMKTDAIVRKFLGGPISKEEATDKFFKYVETGGILWTIRNNDTGFFIGFVYITKYYENQDLEISYEINPKVWRQGYAYEVLKHAIPFFFEYFKVKSLYSETQEKNIASCRLLEKIGMSLEKYIERHGETQCVYKILKSNFNI